MLRRHLTLTDLLPLRLHSRAGNEVTFRVEGARWRVVVHREVTAPAQLTCRARTESSGWAFRAISIEMVR